MHYYINGRRRRFDDIAPERLRVLCAADDDTGVEINCRKFQRSSDNNTSRIRGEKYSVNVCTRQIIATTRYDV